MKVIKFIYLPLFVSCVTIQGTSVKPCSTAPTGLPVVQICTDDNKMQDATNSVIIKADDKKNCSCDLQVENQDQDVKVFIRKYAQETSSSPSEFGCGLILRFKIIDQNWDAQCKIDNNRIPMILKLNTVMTIKSESVNGTLKQNEGYCIEIKKDIDDTAKNQLKLTCGIGSTTTTESKQSSGKTTEMTQASNPTTTTKTPSTTTAVPTSTIITTTTIPTTSSDTNELAITTFTNTDSYVTTNKATQPKHKDNDDTITLTVMASFGGFVTIIVVIVIVCIYRRNHPKTTSKRGPAVKTDTDDYGLHDNVLYVSSGLSETTDTHNNPEFSFDNDGNYSKVDLDETLQVAIDDSTGDYSSIDLVNLAPTESNINGSPNEKPVIAPKPKQKKIHNDVYSVPDKKKVKHVSAPGENECEYAVVSKPNKSNVDKSEDQPSTSNVYAVIEKTKRISDRKGTNQKRDSLTSENDRETGRSSNN